LQAVETSVFAGGMAPNVGGRAQLVGGLSSIGSPMRIAGEFEYLGSNGRPSFVSRHHNLYPQHSAYLEHSPFILFYPLKSADIARSSNPEDELYTSECALGKLACVFTDIS
jgi:hypothetical protein